jgi:hypothetical protein
MVQVFETGASEPFVVSLRELPYVHLNYQNMIGEARAGVYALHLAYFDNLDVRTATLTVGRQ